MVEIKTNSCCGPDGEEIQPIIIDYTKDLTEISQTPTYPSEITIPNLDYIKENWDFSPEFTALIDDKLRWSENDPYLLGTGIDAYGNPYPLDNNVKLPPLNILLPDIANEYPGLTPEERETLRSGFDDIANLLWEDLTPEQQQDAINAMNAGGGGGGGGAVGGAGGGISGAAGFSAFASITATLNAILSISAGLSIYLSLDVLIPFLQIIAMIRAGVQILNLFSALVAGIDVNVNLGLKQLVQLLNPLTALNLGGSVPFQFNIDLIPTFGMGTGFGVSFAGIAAGVNASAFASLGISASLGLSAAAQATLAFSLPKNAAEKFENAIVAGVDVNNPAVNIQAELEIDPVPPLPGSEFAPGGGVIPNAAGVEALRAGQRGALCETVGFGERPPTLEELAKKPIDCECKIRLVLPPGRFVTPIKHAIIVNDSDGVLNNERATGLRDALNKSKAQEPAVRYLFDHLKLPYNYKITLSELLLKSATWNTTTPIDPTVLFLLSENLPQGVKLHTAYVMMMMSGSEPPVPALIVG